LSRKKRLEFTKKVKMEIFRRAGGPADPHCEGPCGLPVKGKVFEFDHTLECWEMEDVEHGYREPLTAVDGKLLCKKCHDEKSGKKTGERAHGVRVLEKQARIDRRKTNWGDRNNRFKRKLNGDVVDKQTGEIIRRGR
jgi:hypothetical protein